MAYSSECETLANDHWSSVNNLDQMTNVRHIDEEGIDGFEKHSRNHVSSKRKRIYNVVISDDEDGKADEDGSDEPKVRNSITATEGDDETSDDDDAPISKLTTQHGSKDEDSGNLRQRRLIQKSESESGFQGDKTVGLYEDSLSEHETSYDDDAPISTFMKRHGSTLRRDSKDEVKEDGRKKRLRRLIKGSESESSFEVKNTDYLHGNSLSENETSCDDSSAICTIMPRHSSKRMRNFEDKQKQDVSKKRLTRLRKSDDEVQNDGIDDEFEEEDENFEDEDEGWSEYSDDSSDNAYNDTSKSCDNGDESDDFEVECDNGDESDDFVVYSSKTRSAKGKKVAKIISDDETSYGSKMDFEDEGEEDAQVNGRRSESRIRQDEIRVDKDRPDDDDEDDDDDDDDEDDDDEDDDEESESEAGSMDEFIDYSEEPEDGDKIKDHLKEIVEGFCRKKVWNMNWDSEADMLGDFSKKPKLCMRAVCALYRQQTADEIASNVTIYRNGRGFSQVDAFRGGQLGKFLTDGVPGGDLNKTVKELKEYDSEGIKQCRIYARKYSNQLFKFFDNKEDPYFRRQ